MKAEAAGADSRVHTLLFNLKFMAASVVNKGC